MIDRSCGLTLKISTVFGNLHERIQFLESASCLEDDVEEACIDANSVDAIEEATRYFNNLKSALGGHGA